MAVNQYKRSQLGELGKFLDSLDEKDKKQKETTAVLESKKENQASQYGADLTKFLDSQNDKNKAITKKSHLEVQAKRLWESPVVAETRASNHSFAPLTTEQLSKAETDRQLALKKQQEEAQAAKQKEEAFRASERDYAAKRASLSPVKTGIAHKYTDSDLPVDPILSRASYLAEQAGTGMSKFGTDLKNSVSAISDSSSAFLGKLFGMKSPENGYTPIDSARKSTKPTLRSASDISANGLKDESTLLKKAANAGSEALSDSLEQSILDNAEYAKRREEIEKKYSKAQIGTVSKFLGDIAYGAGYAAPGIAVSKIIPYASVALMGTSNFSGAYAQAKARGDDDEQALKYASLTSIPRMGSEFFFNQLSESLTKKPIAKAVSRIANPYARAAADVGINAAGEGVEETLDYLYDTAVRKAIGEKDVKVNPSEMAYQGLLGAGTSALFGLASYPGKVQAYKFDADFVNAYSKAAAKVDTDEKADILTRVGDIISEKANEIMNDPSSSRDDIARANYYKTAIDDVNNTLKGYKDRIIIDNQETDAAVNSVIFSSADDLYNTSVDLALVVAKNLEPDENPVNATVDVIRDKIQDKKEEIQKTSDNAEKKSLENQVEQLKKADETVRSNRAEIENAVEAQRKTEADKAKTNKPAESTAKTTDVELTADNNNAIIEKDLSQVSKDKGEKLEDSNVKLSKDFEDYSINQQDVIEGYEESVDTSFREFIEREMRGELKQNDSYALKNVSDKAAADIKKAVGVDATGFKTAIEARMVAHILQGHGENGTTDHSMANIDDIARMQFVIDNYDNIEDGGKSKSYFESYVSRSGELRQHTAHTVVYSKKVNGVYYVVEAVPDTKRKTAYIISAYMSKKERNGLSNGNNNENADITRSETSDTAEKPRAFESAPDAHSLNEIISNNSDAVNSEDKKSPKEFSLTHKKFKHTQTGETLDLYTIDGYIDKDKYSKLKDNIKSVGGYYSKYAGGFLVPADKIASVSEFADVTEPVVRDKPEDTVSAVKADEQEATPVETNAVSDSAESDSAQGTREMQAAKETVPPVSATEEAKTELKKDAVKFTAKSQNAKKIATAIEENTISKDNIVYGKKADGFSEEQRKHLVESLITGSQTDADTIHTDVPYDGVFDIKNNPTVIANALDALNVKIKSTEGANVEKIVALVKNASRTYTVKHDGEDYFTDGFALQKVSEEALSEIKTSLAKMNKEVKTSDVDLFGQFAMDNIVSPTKLPFKGYKISSGKTAVAVAFETPDGTEVLVDEKYVKHFDNKNNVWGLVNIKGRDTYALVSMSENGDINGIVMPFKPSKYAILEQSAFKSKSKLLKDITLASQDTSEKESAPQKKSSKTQTITSKSETSNTEVKEKHRAMENGVLPNVIPEVSTSVSDVGNGVSSETVASDSVVNTFYSQIADRILNDYLKTGAALDSKALIEIANSIYGGTLAEGVFDVKDATDSLELAVNRYLLEEMQNKAAEFNGKSAKSAEDGIVWMEELLKRIPTQTKRTDEQVSLQQFSTPPNIAYLANWLANIDSSDFMLEPSAGIGGLAAFAKAFGATTAVNEISERRLGALRSLGFDHVTSEDGAQLDNILPDYIKPTVVVMNPPFSSTGGRTKNSTANAKPHVEQALGRLENGGRLVAILGQGMSNDAPAFAAWWDSLRKQGYNIRANIGIDGTNYRKYGTTFNVRLVVIDKDGSSGSTVTGDYTKLYEIPKVLEEIRNDRRKNVGTAESNRAVEDNKRSSRGARNVSESKRAVSDSVPTENAADMGSGNAVERRVSSDSRRGIRSESDTLEHVQPDTGTAVSGNDEQSGGRGLSSGNDGSVVDVAQNESGRGNSGSIVGGRGSSDRNLSDDLGQSGNADVESSGERRRGGVTKSPKKSNTQKKKANTSDDGIYAGYVPSKLTVKNAQKHPANLVESSAMAAVSSPVITYTPHIDQSIIDKGLISDVQLENISYAGQAHEEMLESGSRRGYFIGDGTGVGKGRQAAGIILDNFNQGRKKALWVSEKAALMEDAKRDWRDIGGNPDQIFNIDGIRKGIGKGKDKTIPTDGILYTTYSMVRSGKTKDSKLTNADKIIEWLGKDFDGVIIYDEAHNMNTLLARGTKKGSQQAIEANKIQEKLPNARVVYMSATGAVEVEDLCFASRLGLWGKGTQFTDANDFTEKIGASGVAGMELVASSLKAMGAYQARSISYEGVRYDSIKHVLSKSQRVMYDTFCEAWQITLQNMEKAIGATKLKNAGTARSLYYSAMQNFYNQVLSSMAMPSVIEDIKKEIAAGHSCVIQLINTNEAQQDRELARVKAEGEDLDDLDITPRGALLGFLENSFPVQQYEEFLDEHGNKQSRPVVDSKGNPVLNKSAVTARDELIERIKEMSIPEGPIDMIINAFGADKVAEVTGRSRRIIMKPDENGNMKKVEETLKPDFRVSETTAFQNGDKHILIFSNAGSTGRSYHADKRAKNQEQRVHYVLQPGWNAKTATQGFGRTHRSNQVSAPIYKLITTDIEGQRRFVTSIARRLDQLGALTKGQRQTGSGIFGEKDNLESPLSRDALRIFYKRLGTGGVAGVDGKDIFRKLGLYRDFFDNEDKFKPSSPKADDITTFLNRLLALKVDEQNIVFGEFETLRQQMYDEAIANGTLDTGISNVKADKITVDQEETIYTDEKTGAETKYVRATAFRKPAVIETVEDAQVYRNAFQGLVRMSDDSVRAVYRIADETTTWGGVMKKYLLQSPNRSVQSRYNEVTMRQKTTKIPEAEWESAWAEERKNVPEFNESTLNIVTGALLPVWNKLPQDGNIKALKIVTDNGDQILGRIISDERIEGVLRQLDVKKKTEKLSGAKIFDMVLKNGKQFTFSQSYSGNNTIKRSRVANENRIEITGTNMWQLKADYPEIFTETIQSSRRYFIPTGKKGVEIIEAINKQYPMKAVSKDSDTSLFFSRADGKWGKGDENGNKIKSLNDLKNEASSLFGVEINTGKVGAAGAAGVYNTHAGTIRTRVHGDLPTIAHELGHHFDKKYKLTELPEVESLIDHYRSDLEDAGYNESLFPYESVAYYFADLMRDAQKTEKMFPEFTQALKATMDKSYTASGKEKINPEAARLKKFMEMSNEYNAADRLRRREAAVHYRHKDESFLGEAQFQIDTFLKNPAAYSGRLGRRFIRHWFDDIVEFENFGKAHDLGMKERAANSIVNGRLTIAFTDNHGKVIGSSLAAVLEEGGINDLNVKAFESYLTVRIALDRIEAGEKDSSIGTRVYADEELQNRDNIIEDIKAYELKNPTFADAAKGVYEYENHLLDIAVDSGIISEKLSNSLKELFPHYVPLYRSMRDSSGAYSGRGSQTPSSVVKRFKGSGRDVNSPIENIMYQTAAWSKAILQNETRKEVFDYIDKNENMGMWAEKVPESKYYDMVRTDEIASKIAGFDSDKLSALSSEDKAELVDEIMKTIGNSTGMWKKRQYQGKNVVSVMRNGNPVYYEIHDDGLMEAFKALTPSQTSIVMRIFGTITNAFTAVTTGSNPRFGYTNLQRDAQSGYIFSKTQDNPFAYTLDLIKAFGESVINSEDYKAYVSNGGGYTGAFTMNMGRLKEKYNEIVKSSNAAKMVIGNIKDFIPHVIESVESASRYAEYKRNIKEGADALDALRAAQNITVNFQQGGSYSKAVGRFIPFFNASMTSLYQNIRRLNPTDKDKRVLIKWLGMNLLLPALVIAFNEMMKLVLDDDDDPDEAYSRLSAYNKNANWNFYIGDGQFVRIPKERSLMVPASLLSATYEYYATENPEAFYNYGEYILDSFLPPGPADATLVGSLLDLATNKTFTGAPIVPTAYTYRAKPEQYNERTSELAISLGSALGLSPMQIDYLIDDNLGFVGDLILNLTKQGGAAAKDILDLTDTSKKSILGGISVPSVVMRDSTYSTDIVSIFYDTKENYDKNAASYKATGGQNDRYSFYDTYGKYKYGKVADLYSDVNKLIKSDKNSESSRETRWALNTIIKSVNETEKTQLDEDVAKLAYETGSSMQEIAPYIVVPESIKSKDKKVYSLDAYDMMNYYTESQALFEIRYKQILSAGYDADSTAAALKEMKKEIKAQMDERYLEKLRH